MKIIMLLMSMALFGCANVPVDLMSVSQLANQSGFATIADANDPVEMAAAPVYTELAMYRFSAAKALRNKEIPVEQAETVQRNADAVRVMLDSSVKRKSIDGIKAASVLLDTFKEEK